MSLKRWANSPPSRDVFPELAIGLMLLAVAIALSTTQNRTFVNTQNYSPEIEAFLDVIQWAETGTLDESGYKYIVFQGYKPNLDLSKGHPFVEGGLKASENCEVVLGKRLCSSASGAYQVMDFNWKKLKSSLNLTDFSPASQDEMAIALIEEAGAMEDVRSLNFRAAACKVGKVWASFPCNNYGQPQKLMQELEQKYRQILRQKNEPLLPRSPQPG